MTSASSRWPFPETPAMPRISPAAHLERYVVQRLGAEVTMGEDTG